MSSPQLAPEPWRLGFHTTELEGEEPSMAAWLTLDEARDRWRDAPMDDDYLAELLDVVAEQILSYGRADTKAAIEADPQAVPSSYRLAQLTQARNTWNAIKSDPATGGLGEEGYVFRPYPMDGTVQQMIRPKQAKPVVA